MSQTDTVAELTSLTATVSELEARVRQLEERLRQDGAEVSEDVLLIISAACAAYLGKRATVKQVHLRRGGAWVSQGRSAVQESHGDLRGRR